MWIRGRGCLKGFEVGSGREDAKGFLGGGAEGGER